MLPLYTPQVPGLMSRSGIFTDGSFVISTVIKEDTGWYKCRPSNGLGPPPEAQAYLNVTCKYTRVAIVTGPRNSPTSYEN